MSRWKPSSGRRCGSRHSIGRSFFRMRILMQQQIGNCCNLRLDKAVNETHKFKLIAALQQRQHESAKDFHDRCKTAWYGLLREVRANYATEAERAVHNDTRNECIKCMFICRMRNDVRMAVEQIAGYTNLLDMALAAAV
jgi:hypothetical protein